MKTGQDLDFGMLGIARADSQERIKPKDELGSKETSKTQVGQSPQKRAELQGSLQLNEMNILGLKDYYNNCYVDEAEQKAELKVDQGNSNFLQLISPRQCTESITQPLNNAGNLDQLGQRLNDVIGQYLIELTQQTKLSLDSFSLQNSETLDEEQQQQILDLELNAIRQRIYKNIVEKINLSVIQSVQSYQTLSNIQSQQNSKELTTSNVQISQISQRSPPKSLAQSLLDLQQQILLNGVNTQHIKPIKKLEEQYQQILQDIEKDQSKEELLAKLKVSLQLNKELIKHEVEVLPKQEAIKALERRMFDNRGPITVAAQRRCTEIEVRKFTAERIISTIEMQQLQQQNQQMMIILYLIEQAPIMLPIEVNS